MVLEIDSYKFAIIFIEKFLVFEVLLEVAVVIVSGFIRFFDLLVLKAYTLTSDLIFFKTKEYSQHES